MTDIDTEGMDVKDMDAEDIDAEDMDAKDVDTMDMGERDMEERDMEEKRMKKIRLLTQAFGIAFMPPIWAVLAPFIGVDTGSVALICAGLFAANGNKRQDTFKIRLGFLLGDLWALTAVWIMEALQWNPNVELYLTLFILGGTAVIAGETFAKVIYTPAWLCGWAIGLTVMGPMKMDQIGTLPVQIGIAMLAGVIYVGVGVDAFQNMLIRWLTQRHGRMDAKGPQGARDGS